jgi:hypothetical protein
MWPSNTDSTPSSEKKNTTEIDSSTYEEEIQNTSLKIKKTSEFQDCMKQQTNMCIQTTGMQLAQKMKDPGFCKELSNNEQRSSCEFAITMINAQEKNDITLCNILEKETYKQQCRSQVYKQDALLKNDITLCDKIDTTISLVTSGAISPQDSSQKDQCIMQFIMNTKNSQELDCERIFDESSFMMCKLMFKEKEKWSKIPKNPTSIQK